MSDGVRLILLGPAGTELRLAGAMARDDGAHVLFADSNTVALELARAGRADLILADVNGDVPGLLAALRAERLRLPVLGCGIDADAGRAVAAVRAGALDYLPLPPERELIAAVLRAALQPGRTADAAVAALVGHTVEDVERDLILGTLENCGGNRTLAAQILGISVRTMRNKLRAFIDAGHAVAPAVNA